MLQIQSIHWSKEILPLQLIDAGLAQESDSGALRNNLKLLFFTHRGRWYQNRSFIFVRIQRVKRTALEEIKKTAQG